jgi:hypothetical protein
VILTSLQVDPSELARRTGWALKPEGACKGDTCVPLPDDARSGSGTVDVSVLAARVGMPLLHDDGHGVWALGPEAGMPTLASVEAPDLRLPDIRTGEDFSLRSLLGKKVVVVSWASW